MGVIPASMGAFAAVVCFANLSIGFFNLIPFPPMDGFTFLRGLLPFRYAYSLRDFEARVHSWGAAGIILVLLIFSYVFAGVFFGLISRIFNLLIGV